MSFRITLPVGEIADFSELLVGDPKNIWDRVSIETVGGFVFLFNLKLKSTDFTNLVNWVNS